MKEKAIEYFKFHRKIFCEDHLKICPKDSIAYQATLKEKEFYDMAIKALEQKPSTDAISRQALMSAFPISDSYTLEDICKTISFMPSVTPTQRWIPCSERLPKVYEFVNCTCHSLIDDREDWVVETVYIPQASGSPYSDWGNIPMLNDEECEVIAWMYRNIPEPYKAEMESE